MDARAADLSGFIAPGSPWVAYADGSLSSATGIAVSPDSAIANTVAVYACVALLADVIGSLPLHLYRVSEDGRERIYSTSRARGLSGRGYPGSLARVLGELPNSEMSAQTLWETVVGHGALWGTAYVNVVRGADGRVSQLWPLRPDRIETKRDSSGELYYVYYIDGARQKPRILYPEEVMRVPWFGTSGVTGISPVSVARNDIAISQAASQFAGKWYKNSAMPSSIVTIPRGPQDKFKERSEVYRAHLQALHGGMDNAARIAVVEEGVDWKSIQMPMADMQFMETRKFQISEIARLFRIPPHMIGDVERSTSWGTGIEQQSLGFLTYTLRPILSRIEAAICRDLGLIPGEKTLPDEGLYSEFLTADLLRTDTKGRYEAYEIAIRNRIMSPTDVAQLENLEPNPERPTEYENPNTSAPDPTPDPTPEPPPDMGMNARDEQMDALMAVAVSALGREPHIEVHNSPQPVQLTLTPPDIRVESPDVTVNIPKQPPAVVNVLPQPEAKATSRKIKRDEQGRISEIEET